MKALYFSEMYEFNAALNVALYLILLVLLVEKSPQRERKKTGINFLIYFTVQ